MSLWDMLSDESGPRVFRGPAPFSHKPGPSYGLTRWYIRTELDDWPLGPFDTRAVARAMLAQADEVLARRRNL